MDTADQYCQEKTAKSGSSFYYSFLFLPPEQQTAIMAVYAFCREVDDIVDECTDKEVAQKKLAWWHTEIDRVFSNTPEHPVGKALANIKDRFTLKKHLFEEILQGMSMDLAYQGYQTFDDLKLYCHCVASAPGLLAAEIFGYQNPNTLEYAKNLGVAFQLVNIIRDVGEDAGRGRIYLPEDELAHFSLTPQDILEKKYTQNFQDLMQYQATRARSYYQKALLVLPETDKYHQKSGIIMAEIYFALLTEIEKLKFQVLHQRVSLTPLRKLWIAWKTKRRIQ
jgi:phytoene synthase